MDQNTEATNRNLGYEMYGVCKKSAEDVLASYNTDQSPFQHEPLESKDVDRQEFVVAFMWALYDLLCRNQNLFAEFEKMIPYIFAAYLSDWNFLEKEERGAELDRIDKRFDEYKNLFGSAKRDPYWAVASMMCNYILGHDIELVNLSPLQLTLGLHLQQFVITWGNFLKQIKLTEDASSVQITPPPKERGDLQGLLDTAQQLKKAGGREGALKLYNQAFDLLTSEASAYARGQEESIADQSGDRKILPAYFNKAKQYLKRDKTAAVISNNMAVIFAELHDYASAKTFFEQAVDLTPDGVDCLDPKIGLENLVHD